MVVVVVFVDVLFCYFLFMFVDYDYIYFKHVFKIFYNYTVRWAFPLQPIKFKADGPESPTTPWCSGTTASGQSHAGVRRRFSPGRDDEERDFWFSMEIHAT